MAGESDLKQTPRRPSRSTILLAIVLAAIVGIVAFLSGVAYESGRPPPPPTITVTPMLVPYGKVANFSISSNCDGASQASANGWWECDIDLENLGESYGGVVNASAPSAVNVVVSHLPFMVVPGGSNYFEVTGQLGYTGSVAVYFELYA